MCTSMCFANHVLTRLTRGMTWGATLVAPQAVEWHTSIAHSATSLNYGILLQGIGGIFAVPLIDAYGR